VLGISLLLDGALMLFNQLGIAAPLFDSARASWPQEAVLLMVGGAGLIAFDVDRLPRTRWARLAQAPAIVGLLVHLVTSGALSGHVWTGIAYWGGSAIVLGALPFVQP
jgi:hypothetical protein